MTKDEIYKQLAGVAAEVFGVPLAKISRDLKAGTIQEWDSFGHLRFFMAIEEKLNIKFSTEEIINLSSLEEIGARIKEKKKCAK